jgi:hypothetical protein
MNAFEIGIMTKIAAGNPASPHKSSLGDGPIDMGLATAYLNMGGGKAGQQVAGGLNRGSPSAAYLNMGGGQAGEQGSGLVNRHASPDSGELGMGGGGATTKSAAWEAGLSVFIGE